MGAAVADGQKCAQAKPLQRGSVIELRFDRKPIRHFFQSLRKCLWPEQVGRAVYEAARFHDGARQLPRLFQLLCVRAGKAACQLRLPAAAQREFFLIRAAADALDRREQTILPELRRRGKLKRTGCAFQLQRRLDRLAVQLLTGQNIPPFPAADPDGIAAALAGQISCFQIRVVCKNDVCLQLLFHIQQFPSPAYRGL